MGGGGVLPTIAINQASHTMIYSDYLETDYWKAVAAKVKARAGYRCQLCNSQHDLCAHHRTYDHRGKELDYLDDLTCLCRRCHEIFHGKGKRPDPVKNTRPLRPEGRGMVFNLTKRMINECRTEKGGFTSATIKAFGVTQKSKGWVDSLIGEPISSENYGLALEGREIFGGRRMR